MELYQRQQFDFLLLTAVDRSVERLVQRTRVSRVIDRVRPYRLDTADTSIIIVRLGQ